ncbi:response regulator [Bacillus salipaludis]|uniref:Response regulator n=1 Tax=Bacillus salipaludis TaxID=2547811 RepID=A0AA90QSY2_9BACI|nr:helix-turn-helix domain-containing protein [Bacillus salipaludis]MDQ6595659.1 response regulator [Bacillus salipaludis]
MVKILLVDDEALERKAIGKMIQKSVEDVEVIGEAPNGRKAVELAVELNPDIIFMDIKMPGMDGVQAVKEIKKLNAAIKFIMVSAFNTFEYAKEVMQQGVKEYILKPSRKQDILDSLARVSSEIQEERKQQEEQQSLRESLNRAVTLAQKEWVSSLIINQVQDITFEEWGQLLGVEITTGYIMLFSLKPKDQREFTATEKQIWYTWLKEALHSVVKKQEIMIGPLIELQVPVLFLWKKSNEKLLFKSLSQYVIESLLTHFQKESFQAELRIGVGHPYHHAYELNKSYHEAVMALNHLMKNPNQKYLIGVKQAEQEENSTIASEILEMEKKLLEAVRQGDVNKVLFLFDSFITKHQSNSKIEAAVVKKSFDELFILISRMLHDLGVNLERTPVVHQSEEVAEMLEAGKAHLISIVQSVQQWRTNHAKGMLQKAKDYIEKNFADTITLESVAEYVELSPFYFSKLFKDRFGMTFIDYLTEIRIKEAKALMENPGKSLKEICYSVGYKDPNYFSRVFKKLTGSSPSEFRKAVIKE